MKILVIGSGGREHALARKFMKDPMVTEVYCAPGNPGMVSDGIKCLGISIQEIEDLIAWAQENKIAWTFVGPEEALFNGIVDQFKQAGLKVFGPSQEAAQLESSKKFAKELLLQNQIPTARFESFNQLDQALSYLEKQSFPLVIKADGPAAGKGVIIANNLEEGQIALQEILADHRFGDQAVVVIEEYLTGPEFSFFSLVGLGQTLHLPTAQDHKRAYDHDLGPNTGGMGAYAPVPFVSDRLYQEVIETIVEPTLEAMIEAGIPFTGVLYTGLMLTQDGPKVIEFNTRFGDPETQVLMELVADDFAQVIADLLANKPTQIHLKSDQASALGVVLAAEGYPNQAIQGSVLDSFVSSKPDSIQLLMAGVTDKDQSLVSQGGRILMAVSTADDLRQAYHDVYTYLDSHPVAHTFYRHDIGAQAIVKEEIAQ
ncbi:phosphoribosylamine--glycine ligase [Hutsoniella sourekii]